MDPSLDPSKSTIIPSVLDLCPVTDSCNWGLAIATLLRGLCVCTVVHAQLKETNYPMRSSHLWLVSIGVQHHCPLRSVVAVAKAKLLHEDFVLAVLPTLNDQALHQLFLTQVNLEPLAGKGLRLRQQSPTCSAGQKAGVFRHPAPIRMRGCRDLVVCNQTRYHAQHARAWIF